MGTQLEGGCGALSRSCLGAATGPGKQARPSVGRPVASVGNSGGPGLGGCDGRQCPSGPPWPVGRGRLTSILGACSMSQTHPHPTESPMGTRVAWAARLRPASFGPGARSLPSVHGVGGRHAAQGREPPRGQPPGAGGHGAGAEAGDAAGERETGPPGGAWGRGAHLGPGHHPRGTA